MRKTVKILSLVLLLLAALIGALFLARPSVIDLRRQRAEKQIIELIKSGRTDISSITLDCVMRESISDSLNRLIPWKM